MVNQKFKGIVLAGGLGSRLNPITLGVSKQLLPIYDKPMIYYPLSVLMLAKIQEILLITSPLDIENYKRLLGDGSQFGISINYAVQPSPSGIGQGFIIGEHFIGKSNIAMILGDNIFYGQNFTRMLDQATSKNKGALIFGYYVRHPEQFGVIELDKNKNVISVEEKPKNPKSNFAVTGLYFFDKEVSYIAKNIKPSERGELEITDIINVYREKNALTAEILGRGFAWLDTGTCDSLLEAGGFVQTLERRQGLKVACLEEIAFSNGWISCKELREQAQKFKNTNYGRYLNSIFKIN